jgi:hypothetical protein
VANTPPFIPIGVKTVSLVSGEQLQAGPKSGAVGEGGTGFGDHRLGGDEIGHAWFAVQHLHHFGDRSVVVLDIQSGLHPEHIRDRDLALLGVIAPLGHPGRRTIGREGVDHQRVRDVEAGLLGSLVEDHGVDGLRHRPAQQRHGLREACALLLNEQLAVVDHRNSPGVGGLGVT